MRYYFKYDAIFVCCLILISCQDNRFDDDPAKDSDQDSEEVVIPNNISGTFLTCRPLASFQAQGNSLGCRVSSSQDGKKDPNLTNQDLDWTIQTGDGGATEAQIYPQPDNAAWHISIFIPAADRAEWDQKVATYQLTVAHPDLAAEVSDTLQNAIDIDQLIQSQLAGPPLAPQLTQNADGLTLSWQPPVQGQVLIARWNAAEPLTAQPSDQVVYNAGDNLGNGTVIYKGSGQGLLDQSVTAGETYSYQFWVFNEEQMTYTSAGHVHYVRSCQELKLRQQNLVDGIYPIDADGFGNMAGFTAYCDMQFDGGGWTLVLNYVHAMATNPELTAKTDRLPLLNRQTLGDDASSQPAYWGHASNQLMNRLNFDTVRFWCTADHQRILHFRSSASGCQQYFKTGTGNCSDMADNSTFYTDHTAMIQLSNFQSDHGDEAMTKEPFFVRDNLHWNIHSDYGEGNDNRWECDVDVDTEQSQNTIHRIWIR